MEQNSQYRRRRNRILPAGNGSVRKPKQNKRHQQLPAPTSTRFANTRRIFESHSDLELEHIGTISSSDETEIPDDAVFIPSLAQPHSIYATEEEHQLHDHYQPHNWEPQERHLVPLGTGRMMREFFNSNFQETWNIGALTILREWRRMAQELQHRRDELLTMWLQAFNHQRLRLLGRVLGKWKVATRVVLADPQVQYEKTLRKLADGHYRTVLLKNAFGSMLHVSDLNKRLSEWTFMRNARTVVNCLDVWRKLIADRRLAVRKKLTAKAHWACNRRIATSAVSQWRKRLAEKQRQEQKLTKHKRRDRALTRDRHTVTKYQPNTNSQRRWNQASEESVLDEFMERNAVTQRNVLKSWRLLTRQLEDFNYRAEAFYKESLVFDTFDTLASAAQSRKDQQGLATRFDRYHTITRALETMRSVHRARRSEQVQAHALRDWTRKNQQRKRRTLLLAWHKVVVKDHGLNESAADRIIAQRNRDAVLACFNSWRALCRQAQPARRSISAAVHTPQAEYPDEHHRPVEYVDAQTMTSMVGADLTGRMRAASIRSEGVQTSDRDDDTISRTTMLLKQRVRVAEEEADHYKMLAAESDEAAMALHFRMRELGPLLDRWEMRSRHRTMISFLSKARACVQSTLRRRKYAEMQRVDKARAVVLEGLLLGWRKIAHNVAKLETKADEWRCSHRRPHNRNICHAVFTIWRLQLKKRNQLYMSADARNAYRLKRRCMNNLCTLRNKILDMNVDAAVFRSKMMAGQVWLKFIEYSFAKSTMHRQNSENAQLLTDRDVLHLVDSEAGDGFTQDTEPEQFSWDALNRTPDVQDGDTGATNFALTDAQEQDLFVFFSQWHELVAEMRGLQEAVTVWLPEMLRGRAAASASTDADGFEWELVYYKRLLHSCLQTWRGRTVVPNKAKKQKTQHPRITEAQEPAAMGSTSAAGECEPKQLADLQQRELRFGAWQALRTKRRVLNRAVAVFRGNLLEIFLQGQMQNRAVLLFVQQARRIAKLRELERSFVPKMAIKGWRQRMHVQKTNSENASAMANGTLVRSCLLRWRSMLRKSGKNSTTNEERALFMRAIAFRWEKQARMALTRWMHVCKSVSVRVALAQRCTDASRRQGLLMDAAADACDKRIAKSALDRLRRIAWRRQLHKELKLRFASAWCNANTKRHAINVWRARISPSSSMFFSVADLSE
ncbi:hypothetical protein IW140_002266 [Coemansia sp. RSA 1813]|nr:hypothetical protein EV178_001776 [Coemansia sp. RSA 1646]KAJ1770910.1 hypothetical protein LPJ74_002806 [Coemansia sp. RSA 1843]KAJ2216232.1 hypothetical protein EV179_001470 [Coemansia sp. RSA 487]KAJ2570594.1 hypothetical protein IW140_002266 [Coemansia sp. RSA 1813]